MSERKNARARFFSFRLYFYFVICAHAAERGDGRDQRECAESKVSAELYIECVSVCEGPPDRRLIVLAGSK